MSLAFNPIAFSIPIPLAASPFTGQYVAAVGRLQALVSGRETFVFEQFLDQAKALRGSYETVGLPQHLMGEIDGLIAEMERLNREERFTPVLAQAFLATLSGHGIFPLADEDPAEAARELRRLIQEGRQVQPVAVRLFEGARAAVGGFMLRVGRRIQGPFQASTRRTLVSIPTTEWMQPSEGREVPTGETPTMPQPTSLDAETRRLMVQGLMVLGSDVIEGTILSDIEVEKELGRGGSGSVVYVGRQLGLERKVAVKIGTAHQGKFRRMFENEMRLQAGTESEGIVAAYAAGQTALGEPFLVMEHLAGGNLQEYLEKVEGREVPWNLETIVGIASQAAAAAAEAHRRGIIHKDIKPGNYFFKEEGGRLKLGDFGIAERVADVPPEPRKEFGGTPDYLAPEAWDGKDSPRRDVFALGITLYEMLTGDVPYTGTNPYAIYLAMKRGPAPRPPSEVRPERKIPKALDRITMKAMAINPDERYADAQGLFFDLATYKAQALEEEAHEIAGQKTALVVEDSIRRARWRELLEEALKEYRRVYQLFPSDAIKERMVAIDLELYQWADQTGNDDLVRAATERVQSLAPSHPALREMGRPILIHFSLDGDLGGTEPQLVIARSHHRGGYVVFDKFLRLEARSSSFRISLPRGAVYGLRLSGKGLTPLFIPLPVRPGEYQIRIPIYPEESIPEGFVIVPAGPVAVRERPGSYSELHTQWREVDHDYAIGPPVTNAQWVFFLDRLATEERVQEVARRRPQNWETAPVREGARDTLGHQIHLDAPVTHITYEDGLEYLRLMLPEARYPTLEEWKRAMRGNDPRMFSWGDGPAEFGIVGFRFPGRFEEAVALPNGTEGIRDYSPFSVPLGTDQMIRVPHMAGNVSKFLYFGDDPADRERLLRAVGLTQVDPSAADLSDRYVLIAGIPYNSPAPTNPDIIQVRPNPSEVFGPIGIMPVIPLRRATPTPSIASLAGRG